VPPPPAYSDGAARESTVAKVQRELKRRGYYAGPVDGDAGRGTRGAIIQFREDQGLGSSTRIDNRLLRALGL
jgi:peptidoglycan hydrolase-like protein with peptidoglycan-binding domain